MHELTAIRKDPELFDREMKRRSSDPCSEFILSIDSKKRATVTELQELQNRRNKISKDIGLKKRAGDDASLLVNEVAKIKTKIQELEELERDQNSQLNSFLSRLPNVLASDVPEGVTESDNVEIRSFGVPQIFNFKAKDHVELGEGVGGLDFSSAAKISGSRFVFLKASLARLERALSNFMLDHQVNKFGYTEVSPPLLVSDKALYGTGQLPKFSDQQFKTTDDYWLIPTSEVPLTNLVSESILDEAELPLRYTAYTPCFRSEAGASGQDTKGMIRVHQFGKVEMVSVVHPDKSDEEHERMTECAEDILRLLGIPYRTVLLCAGDTGFSANKTYDIEAWLPGQDNGKGKYREISSCSLCGSFQARRMMARFRKSSQKDIHFVHTLNGSGLAVGRTIIAILENYQQRDGSIKIPAALKPYMDGKDTIVDGQW
jgi:seryl-tRNA synthetase